MMCMAKRRAKEGPTGRPIVEVHQRSARERQRRDSGLRPPRSRSPVVLATG
ncbi:unnamed protein product [Ectocarpus sp. CCAP 1310/34]|nr:unnamed protein product [Ectocarpus sp. CCAP 1310/34]